MGMLLQRHYENAAAKIEAVRSAQLAEVEAARAQQLEIAIQRSRDEKAAAELASLEEATRPEQPKAEAPKPEPEDKFGKRSKK